MKVPRERIRQKPIHTRCRSSELFLCGRRVCTESRVHPQAASGKPERDSAWFRLDEMSRLGKPTETARRLAVARG